MSTRYTDTVRIGKILLSRLGVDIVLPGDETIRAIYKREYARDSNNQINSINYTHTLTLPRDDMGGLTEEMHVSFQLPEDIRLSLIHI